MKCVLEAAQGLIGTPQQNQRPRNNSAALGLLRGAGAAGNADVLGIFLYLGCTCRGVVWSLCRAVPADPASVRESWDLELFAFCSRQAALGMQIHPAAAGQRLQSRQLLHPAVPDAEPLRGLPALRAEGLPAQPAGM